jgi:ribose transport system permease protein
VSTGISYRTRGESAAGVRERPVSRFIFEYGMVWIGVLVVIVAELIYPDFLSWSNIRVMLNQGAPLGMVAVGQTLVILVGGFDLSVASVLALSAVVYSQSAQHHALLIAAIIALACGLAAGALNAVLVTRANINAFIATLATGSAIGGFSYITSHSLPVQVNRASFATLGNGSWLGLPIDGWLLIAALVIAQVVLSRTKYGRSIYATGGNREAARLAGLRVDVIRGSAFVAAGGLAAFGGLILASHLSLGQANFAGSFALDSIAIVVIGGTALTGGEGSVWRTAIGFVIITTITDVLNAKAVNAQWGDVIVGAVLAGAAGLDYMAKRARERSGVRSQGDGGTAIPDPEPLSDGA